MFFSVLCAAGFMVYYLWRDLRLPQNVIFDKLPDVVVENLDFRREIDGRNWHVRALTAEHEEGTVRASSIDLTVREDGNDEFTEIRAVSGDFTQDTSDVTLNDIKGRMHLTGREIDMEAPAAEYDAERELWVFPHGIEVWDDRTRLRGEIATITPEGIFHVEKGAEMFWEIQ